VCPDHPGGAAPDTPADLKKVEREAWSAYATPLAEAGALQSIHLPMLRQLAIAVGIAERAHAELEEGGALRPRIAWRDPAPGFRAWSQAIALVARLSAEFGGSPAALTHIGLSQLRG
jgi:phage terminase small subunit